MHTLILAFGPDPEVSVELAKKDLCSDCRVSIGETMTHIDESTAKDVLIVPLYHMNYRVVVLEAEVCEVLVYEYTDKQYEGFSVLDRELNLHTEEGKPISKLVVYREPSDYSPLRIVWTIDHYFPTMTGKKLSGKKLILKG